MDSHFPSVHSVPEIDPNVHMFNEDICLAIMPIGGRTNKKSDFAVEFIGEEKDCEKAKEIVGELGEFDKYDTAAMVCDAVENIARHLAWEGQAVYEIIKDNEQIYFHSFTSKNLFRMILWYLQIVPPKDWGVLERKFTLINIKKIWIVKIPKALDGVRGYKRVLKKLRKYNHLSPKFFRKDLERGLTKNTLDYLKYVKYSEIYYNRVTHKWGWNRRDWSQKNCTEFYTFYKMLCFRYSQAILREHIIQEINKLLDRLSIECKLAVVGLPTTKDILQIRNDMFKGDITFTEVYEKVAI